MITIRRADDRFRTRISWLDSRHTFSFGDHWDPEHMGFRALRVINDDRVAPAAGFGSHPHRDMEIISIVLDGVLAHRDSTGTGSVIRPGEVQRMSAGTGIVHSEHNPSEDAPTRFLQIWIEPERPGLAPGYEQKEYSTEARANRLVLVGSRDGRNGSLTIHQDVTVWTALIGAGHRVRHAIAPDRHVWVQVARGAIDLDGVALGEGDGAAVSDQEIVEIVGRAPAEIVLFDLA